MNYYEFYKKATDEMKSVFLSLNGKGDASYRNHMEDMLNAEPLVREPIFQTIFPWADYPQDMNALQPLLGNDIITAMDQAAFVDPFDPNAPQDPVRFDKTWHPYQHQVLAWDQAINHNKSLVVTTGTGSGKTECFMVPILKELYEAKCAALQQGQAVGIQAIFLYPLNALIASQRKRIHAWSQALPQPVTYCIYNGELEEAQNQHLPSAQAAFPQIVTRAAMRATPPQMLFTNPSMLEYMMVRTADQDLRNDSDLKWIVLDEAHVYNGSSAAELAMQIKRILTFFGKTPAQVKFAITSATISTNPTKIQQMHQFIEELTGKCWATDFYQVDGQRIVEPLDYQDSGTAHVLADLNQRFNVQMNQQMMDHLRQRLNSSPALTLNEIANLAGLPANASVDEKIRFVDALSTLDATTPAMTTAGFKPPHPTSLLPTRAHFYVRNINGVYACTNPNCPKHNAYRPLDLGRLTTYKSTKCPDCGGQMLEVLRCSQCHELLLHGQKNNGNLGQPDSYKMSDLFYHEDLFGDIDMSQVIFTQNELLLDAESRIPQPPLPANNATMISNRLDEMNAVILPPAQAGNYVQCAVGIQRKCPKCGESQSAMLPLQLTPNLIQIHLSRILLQQSDPHVTRDSIYEGRKYISFTDNRQKTAAAARLQNIDTERSWIRGSIYHSLVDAGQPQTAIQICMQIVNDPDFKALAGRIDPGLQQTSEYSQALMLDQMGTRSLRSAVSLETLGLVHWIYPGIDAITMAPASFVNFFNYQNPRDPNAVREWKNFLRILIDVTIRGGHHVDVPFNVRNFLPHSYPSTPIYAWGANLPDVTLWPSFDRNDPVLRREFLLLLFAKNITSRNNITNQDEADINGILSDAWNALTGNLRILTPAGALNRFAVGYKLNIFNANAYSARLDLQTTGVQCPVTKQILDVTFMGLSPLVKGELCQETKDRYTVDPQSWQNIPAPTFSRFDPQFYVANQFDEHAWRAAMDNWIDQTYRPAIEPVWGDINYQTFIMRLDNVYLAKEHSAQLSSEKLRQSEKDFIAGKLNLLDCSTTMEMGVDIGGLQVVTMNNIPPKPQNYQQRVGRAGRRQEQKAMAMTIYSDNPIGRYVEANPKWAIEHDIEPSFIAMHSENLIYRHLNAVLLAGYLSNKHITIKDYLGDFIMGHSYPNNLPANYHYNGFVQYLQNLRLAVNGTPEWNVRMQCMGLVQGTCLQQKQFVDIVNQADNGIRAIYQVVSNSIQDLLNQIANAHTQRNQARLGVILRNIWHMNLFSYLGKEDYLPNAYMPTNVTELRLVDADNDRTNPQRETQLAINEYAPGQDVIVDEFVYRSEGIAMKTLNGAPVEEQLFKCDCGYYTKNLVANNNQCPNCGLPLHPLFDGQPSPFTIGVEPLAFIAGEPTRRRRGSISRHYQSNPYLLNSLPWQPMPNGAVYSIHAYIGDASILYVNRGNGYGFSLCTSCGHMESEENLIVNNNLANQPARHTKPSTRTQCAQPNYHRNVVLLAEIKTNLTEFRITPHQNLNDDEKKKLVVTLGTIMSRKFAEILGVDDDEIDYGIIDLQTFFIFDTHCGGSCYSNKLSSQTLLESLFDKCLQTLSSCNCQNACTHCLVDRRSQYNIDYLDRNLAIDWLRWEQAQRNNIPQTIRQRFPGLTISKKTNTPDIEIAQMVRNGNYTWLKYFIDSKRIVSSSIYSMIKHELDLARLVKGKTVSLMVDQNGVQSKSRLALYNLTTEPFTKYSCGWTLPGDVYPICMTDTELYLLYDNAGTEEYYVVGNYANAFALQNETLFNPAVQMVWIGNGSNRLHMHMNIDQFLVNILGNGIVNVDNYVVANAFRGSAVDIEYTDIYVKNPVSCILLCTLIKQVRDRYGLTINSFVVNTSNQFAGFAQGNMMEDDFAIQNDRDVYLSHCARTILGCNVTINVGQLPHDRNLEVTGVGNSLKLTIEPDAGFGYGWKLDDPLTHQGCDQTYPENHPFWLFNYKKYLGIKYSFSWGK